MYFYYQESYKYRKQRKDNFHFKNKWCRGLHKQNSNTEMKEKKRKEKKKNRQNVEKFQPYGSLRYLIENSMLSNMRVQTDK